MCKYVYESVNKIFISQCKQIQILMGVFESAWTRLSVFFALFLYNESVMISSLTYNVFIHINFQCCMKSVVLKYVMAWYPYLLIK